MLPALRLAQAQHGWLSPEVIREVADALDETPAYVQVDRVVLRPVPARADRRAPRRGLHERSCAVVGAQQVVEAFESGFGCKAGETSADGQVTLRAVECLGGCGWATIVAVDHHYRTHVKPDDVPAIVEELRG